MPTGTDQRGVTLIELLITIVVLAIIMAYGVPNLTGYFERQRVSGAAHSFLSDLQLARAESIKQNEDVYVYVDPAQWCYALDDDTSTACSCSASASSCTINGNQYVVSGTDFPDVSITENISTAGNVITFDPARGTLAPAATVSFSSGGYGVNVIWGTIGRARICATSGPSWGYDSC